MVKGILLIAAGTVVAASLPSWLPRLVITARNRVLAAAGSEEDVTIPGPRIGADRLREVYAHPHAHGRGPGSKLSDLIWYLIHPVGHVHQEHMSSGPFHSELAGCTRGILAGSGLDVEDLARRCARRVLDGTDPASLRSVRLRDMAMEMTAEFFHELVFRTPCPPGARKLITANADDALGATKFTRLRHLDRRAALTAYLLERIRAGAISCALPTSLDDEHRALYLHGNVFGTGVAQLAEGLSHLLLALAHHLEIQQRMADEPADVAFYDRAINESLRMYPLFGISQRITTGPIDIGGETLPTGSVLVFDYEAYQRSGFEDPDRFDPDRWLTLSPKDATFIPFGVAGNRPCPARGLSTVFMRAVTAEVLPRFVLYSSAGHTRSMPNRAPCVLMPRTPALPRPTAALRLMRIRDDWENVIRSLTQFVLGCVIVADARSQKLCQRHHENPASDTRHPQPKRKTGTQHA
ncbi:cytochrome P450 [Streptomyces rectiverticillatus]|uniref:cytochrome P450 n=1 Tax=Streptomyces rectiverticillatus TaxID=173860 RepID=UPI0015C40016|nr:cytochrome P450 [Streptomyces rectiverticillatus]QLE74599.1 cytochrome P450 [Streptomyces rectiverticillatus]